MGLIISRFRRKKSTGEVLAALDAQIRSIEQYGRSTEQQRRRVVGNLVITCVGLYIIAIIFTYIYYRPDNWQDGIFYFSLLLFSPCLIVFLRYVITRYYDWKLRRNTRKLGNLRTEKKRILEEVMDKETYKIAKDLLDKYGNSEIEKPMPIMKISALSAPASPSRPMISSLVTATPQQLRHRQSGTHMPIGMPTPQRITPMVVAGTPNQITPLPAGQLPRPIMTASGVGAFDRLVDYLIGDGPSNRFALVCSSCKGHNGMALPEEFEYLSFRCAYCRHLNPSRKTRPRQPALMTTPVHTDTSDHKSSSDTSDIEESPNNSIQLGFGNSTQRQYSPSAPSASKNNEKEDTDNTSNDSQHMSVDEDQLEADTEHGVKSNTDKKED